MNEREIESSVLALASALAMKNSTVAVERTIVLSTQVLVDLNRIANALERLASTIPGAPPWQA